MSHATAREQVHSLNGVRRICLRMDKYTCLQAVSILIILIHAWLTKPQFVVLIKITATNKLYSFLQCFAMSFGASTCTFIAQNYGAKQFDRVKQGILASVKIVTVTAVIITGFTLLTRWQILRVFLDVNEAGGFEALSIAVRYLTIMSLCFIVLHILHVFRNVHQAMGIASWSMLSGVAEFIARVFMSKVLIHYIGADALFIAEPASWLGAMLCVLLPYFYYRKKYLENQDIVE